MMLVKWQIITRKKGKTRGHQKDIHRKIGSKEEEGKRVESEGGRETKGQMASKEPRVRCQMRRRAVSMLGGKSTCGRREGEVFWGKQRRTGGRGRGLKRHLG